MKVLIVHPIFYLSGGAEKVIIQLANYLTDNYHQVTILTTSMVDCVRNELCEARLLLCDNLQEMKFVLDQIYSDFDVINVHNHPAELLVNGITVPVVWSLNEPNENEGFEFVVGEKDVIRNYVDHIVLADTFNKERIDRLLGFVKPSSIISYGVDVGFWKKGGRAEKIRGVLGIKKSDFVLSQVSFIAPNKNQLKTLDIFVELKKKRKNAKLVFAGPEIAYVNDVKEKVRRLGVVDDVFFLGLVDRECVRDLYAASDAAVLPVKSQGSWLSVLEGMIAGVPVVISKEMTGAELFKGNVSVCDSVPEYVNAILAGKKASRKFCESFTPERYGERMVEVFNEVIKK